MAVRGSLICVSAPLRRPWRSARGGAVDVSVILMSHLSPGMMEEHDLCTSESSGVSADVGRESES